MKRPSIIIYTIILVAVAIFVWSTAIWTLSTNRLPFDMEAAYHSNPTEVGFLSIVCAASLTVSCVLMFMLMGNVKWRQAANWSTLISWILGMLVFVYGTGVSGWEWMYFFVVTLPPFLCWLATSPRFHIPGEQW